MRSTCSSRRASSCRLRDRAARRAGRHMPKSVVAFDRSGDIASFADGIADPQSGRRVTIDDPVRVASVSKMVTAIGVMKLVDQGKLDLDQRRFALARLAACATRTSPTGRSRLSMLLSHTGSVREHDDDYVIPLGGSLQQAHGAIPRNWDAQHGPGDGYFAYVNLNYPIIGSIVERVTGERFDLWMHARGARADEARRLLQLADLQRRGGRSRGRARRARRGKPLKDDLHGQRPACPVFVRPVVPCDLGAVEARREWLAVRAPGRPRISARGLARIGRMLLNGGEPRRRPHPLAAIGRHAACPGLAVRRQQRRDRRRLLLQRRQRHPPDSRTRLPAARDDLGTSGATLVGHAGDAYGMKSGLWIDRKRGRGDRLFRHRRRRSGPQGPGQRLQRRRSAGLQADLRAAAR